MMNETKCEEYSPEELNRLVKVKYEEKEGGFACSNCNYLVNNDYCRQRDVRTHVKPEGVCTNWEGESNFKPKKC